jgi:hypothetical protein
VARGHGRGHDPSAALQPHLLSRQVLRLPAQPVQRAQQYRSIRIGAHPAELHQVATETRRARRVIRRLGDETLRRTALYAFLQELYRKGKTPPAPRSNAGRKPAARSPRSRANPSRHATAMRRWMPASPSRPAPSSALDNWSRAARPACAPSASWKSRACHRA